MQENRTILFLKHVLPHTDHIIWRNTDHETVKGGVMKLAQGNAIVDRWHALGEAVGDDVGRIEQFPMAQPAERALRA